MIGSYGDGGMVISSVYGWKLSCGCGDADEMEGFCDGKVFVVGVVVDIYSGVGGGVVDGGLYGGVVVRAGAANVEGCVGEYGGCLVCGDHGWW